MKLKKGSIVEEIDAFDSDEDEDDMDDIEFEDDVVYEDLNYDEEDLICNFYFSSKSQIEGRELLV